MSDIRSSIATMLNVNTYAINRNPSAVKKTEYNSLVSIQFAHLTYKQICLFGVAF